MRCFNCIEFIKERETCIFEKKRIWCLKCWNQYVDGLLIFEEEDFLWNQYKNLEYYPNRVCACGCGGRIKVQSYHKYQATPKYIKGHYSKTKEGKKVISEANLGKNNGLVGENHPFYGHHHTEEAKQKQRESKKGENNPAKRPEVGEKIRRSLKNLYENGYINPMQDNHHTEEAKQKMRERCLGKYAGEDNPNWRGGIGNTPYAFEFNEKFKILIRERDNNTCQFCGKTKEQEGQNLAVHHIYYDKENSNVVPERFMTLCNSCNLKVNFRREHWTEFFQLKLEELKNGVMINA